MAISQNAVRNAIDQPAVRETPARIIRLSDMLPGLLALLAAFPLGYFIYAITRALPGQPEKAVELVGIVLGAVVVLPPAVYVAARRRAVNIATLALLLLASAGVVLAAIYLYWVSFYVVFPADILIWSEGDFVNDILKFRSGYPLYTPQVNNDSFTYVPGPQLLTYFLAALSGNATSIPVYRAIQVGYTLLAAIVAALCVRKVLELSGTTRRLGDLQFWSAAWVPVLFLIASNSLTNPFVHNLHDDALAQLFTVVAYYLLLSYTTARNNRVLALMAILPAIGFFVKQSLAVWAVFYCLQLALFERPFSFKRIALFAVVSFGALSLVVLACYLVWGDPFVFWIFTVLGKHGVSPLRSFQHVLDVWVYFVIGLAGGFVLLRGKSFKLLLGPWLIWLALISSETYTSGIAWMINHIGPGCLVAGIWFVAALSRVWGLVFRIPGGRTWTQATLRAAMALGGLGLVFSGLGVVRIPLPPLPQDAYRYMADIEKQFDGQSAANVLIDAGSWVYVKDGVIMKDRAPSIGERGYSETGDFSGFIRRLQEKRYSEILVRNLDSPEFWYDNYLWPKSAGLKQAILNNYHPAGKIPAMRTNGWEPDPGYLFAEITILVPNAN